MFFVLLFLPGTWFCYGVTRYGLSYLNMPVADQTALAFLTGLTYLFSTLMRTWSMWQDVQRAQPKAPPAEAPKEPS